MATKPYSLYRVIQQQDLLDDETSLRELLSHHYGDGLVYVPKGIPPQLIKQAKAQGLIDEEGYITREGRTFLALSEEKV